MSHNREYDPPGARFPDHDGKRAWHVVMAACAIIATATLGFVAQQVFKTRDELSDLKSQVAVYNYRLERIEKKIDP